MELREHKSVEKEEWIAHFFHWKPSVHIPDPKRCSSFLVSVLVWISQPDPSHVVSTIEYHWRHAS